MGGGERSGEIGEWELAKYGVSRRRHCIRSKISTFQPTSKTDTKTLRMKVMTSRNPNIPFIAFFFFFWLFHTLRINLIL